MNLETYISEFSKYIMAIILALYTLEGFIVFLKKKDKRKGVCARQTVLLFLFHFSAFMVICFETENISYLVFYAFQQIVLYAAITLYKTLYPKTNRLIANNMCMLLSISFVVLTRLDYTKALKQFVIATGSLVIALIIPFFIHNLKFIKNLKYVYALLGIGLIGIMLILGQTTYGSKISYSIAGISFMPAEFVKIIFVFFVASAFYQSATFLEVCMTSIIAAIHVIIQVLNNDLGSALIFFIVYICMLYISTHNIFYLLLGLVSGAGASIVAFQHFSHVRVRVQAFLDPWSYIDSAGYQITQSLFAISSGGLFGLGLFKGTPNSIPFVEDDFIFSAITEELGVIAAVSLILICLSCFVCFMLISINIKDKFYQLIAFGLSITYIFQVFLTIGGGTKFIPLTGVTLPLVSYGGTSVLTTLIMFAIIQGICMINEDMEEDEKSSQNERSKKKRKDAYEDERPRKRREETYEKERPRKRREETYEEERPRKRREKTYEEERPRKRREETYEEERPRKRREESYEEERSRKKHAYNYEDEDYSYDDEYIEEYDEEYDEVYEEEYEEEYEDEYEDVEDEEIDEDMEFLHGFTRPIDTNSINEYIDTESIGEIYYNEEEYEKDKRRR